MNNLKDATEILSEKYTIRLTYNEKEAIKQIAAGIGMKPTALIRDVLRQCLLSQEVGEEDGFEQGSDD